MTSPRARSTRLALTFLLAALSLLPLSVSAAARGFLEWAPKPPMGWNSWDCFATTITEPQAKAQADAMAATLAPYGWTYLVVDIQWYEPNAKSFDYRKNASLTMDEFGRLWPATNRFPSSVNGAGFKPLSDYVHAKGLKFGVHLLRGIPRQAVSANCAIKGTTFHARDIADTNSLCSWNGDMFGVDMSKPGAQEYYNSVFSLFAEWGIDFVKVDDMVLPPRDLPKRKGQRNADLFEGEDLHNAMHLSEVEALRKAIDQTGRPMLLSLSPGETPVHAGGQLSHLANLWRISDDFWDEWSHLLPQFERLNKWTPYRAPGHFPDADMLPLGAIRMGEGTRFTRDEHYTLMTLWSIARSPLIFGGDMTRIDPFTLSLLTNREVLAVNQDSSGNRQLLRHNGIVAWMANVPGSKDRYLALFNTQDAQTNKPAAPASISFSELGFSGSCQVRDLWLQKDLGSFEHEFAPALAPHGAGLYRVSGSPASAQTVPARAYH
jgi:hypothetical protein